MVCQFTGDMITNDCRLMWSVDQTSLGSQFHLINENEVSSWLKRLNFFPRYAKEIVSQCKKSLKYLGLLQAIQTQNFCKINLKKTVSQNISGSYLLSTTDKVYQTKKQWSKELIQIGAQI